MTREPTAAEPKQTLIKNYDPWASNYDKTGFVRAAAVRLLELAALCPGEQILDVATGSGLVALPAAQAVGPRGRVFGVDISFRHERLRRHRFLELTGAAALPGLGAGRTTP